MRWSTNRISFTFLDCIACKKRIKAPHCPIVSNELNSVIAIEQDIIKKALERAKLEGIDKYPEFNDPTEYFYKDMEKYAMYKLAYYQCFKCKSPYFGGLKDCI
jgi:hypothetical protein